MRNEKRFKPNHGSTRRKPPRGNTVDVLANRASKKWSKRELAGRVLWAMVVPFFLFSPRPFWVWRSLILRAFGARVGRNVHIYPTVRIAIPWNLVLGEGAAIGDRVLLYSLGRIIVEPRATISQGSHICAGTHDLSRSDRPLLKPQIVIGRDSWIAADAFIGPAVKVGAGAVVGARAVVTRDVPEDCIVAGNPARTIRQL
ncbi:acetyltransferase [Sulfitobacter sp. SH24]|uniref:acetyltransferase n=1 Tax=Sulfitobacter sp. SH24 TaxID=3421173 RepID=UPI003F4FCFAA